MKSNKNKVRSGSFTAALFAMPVLTIVLLSCNGCRSSKVNDDTNIISSNAVGDT